jgi:hypothetical protein
MSTLMRQSSGISFVFAASGVCEFVVFYEQEISGPVCLRLRPRIVPVEPYTLVAGMAQLNQLRIDVPSSIDSVVIKDSEHVADSGYSVRDSILGMTCPVVESDVVYS